jgi:hypothetical protein
MHCSGRPSDRIMSTAIRKLQDCYAPYDLCSPIITARRQFPPVLVAIPQETKRQAVDAMECQYPPYTGVLHDKTLTREVMETPRMQLPVCSNGFCINTFLAHTVNMV